MRRNLTTETTTRTEVVCQDILQYRFPTDGQRFHDLVANPPRSLARYIGRFALLNDGCWEWIGSDNGKGYGEIRLGPKKLYAHRYFYESLRGKIPEYLVIDHLCRNPSCVNPDHHEPVTTAVNVQRGNAAKPHPERMKEYCSQGHLYSENSYPRKDGKGRNCEECVRIRSREYQRRKRRRQLEAKAETAIQVVDTAVVVATPPPAVDQLTPF